METDRQHSRQLYAPPQIDIILYNSIMSFSNTRQMTIQQITKNKNKKRKQKQNKNKNKNKQTNKSKVIPVNEYAQYKTID